ncbi:MAG: hypothetical protein NVS3B10_18590 [Polyangiales bacterium]
MARVLAAVAPLLGAAVIAACGSSQKKTEGEYSRDEFAGESRDIEIKHEPCEPNGHATKVYKADDALSTAKSFVTHVFDGSREICWLADLNGDGKIDVYTYFGDDGLIRRREAGYTVSNAIDEISLYKGGALEIVMRDTTFDGKLDTWDYYEAGKLSRRERDKTGEGRIDEWWTFNPAGGENATIIQADPRTGKPDPTQKLDINVAFGGPAAAPMTGAPTPKASSDAGVSDAPKSPPPPVATVVPATDATYPDAGKKDAK